MTMQFARKVQVADLCGLGCVFVVFVMSPALAAKGPGPAAGNGTLAGFIYAKDVKTPVAGRGRQAPQRSRT